MASARDLALVTSRFLAKRSVDPRSTSWRTLMSSKVIQQQARSWWATQSTAGVGASHSDDVAASDRQQHASTFCASRGERPRRPSRKRALDIL